MNPVSTHTMSTFVWISLLTSNGRKPMIGSGPRYFVIDRIPNTIWSPYSSRATTK